MNKFLMIITLAILNFTLVAMDMTPDLADSSAAKTKLASLTPQDPQVPTGDLKLKAESYRKQDEEKVVKQYSNAIDQLKWSLRNFDKDQVENSLHLLDHIAPTDAGNWKKYNAHILAIAQTARQRSKASMKFFIQLHPNVITERLSDNNNTNNIYTPPYRAVIENAENAVYNEKIVTQYDAKMSLANNTN